MDGELTKIITNKDKLNIVNHVKDMELLTSFVMQVQKGELQQEVLKKLSPLLFFDASKQKPKMERIEYNQE